MARAHRKDGILVVVRCAPGDRDWTEWCEWVRRFLYVEAETGYICYRPRTADNFRWADDPEAAAVEWNAGSANRYVRVYRKDQKWSFARVDGVAAGWEGVRMALGQLGRNDPNRAMPDPGELSDADIVRWWGIDFALMREDLLARGRDRNLEAFDKAVARYEARIGRALRKAEKEVVAAERAKVASPPVIGRIDI